MKFIVYILKSSKDEGYYYGYTSDIEARLIRHNEGLVRSIKALDIQTIRKNYRNNSPPLLLELIFSPPLE
jgi:predicted GIY-YIG superfamily endonuclease